MKKLFFILMLSIFFIGMVSALTDVGPGTGVASGPVTPNPNGYKITALFNEKLLNIIEIPGQGATTCALRDDSGGLMTTGSFVAGNCTLGGNNSLIQYKDYYAIVEGSGPSYGWYYPTGTSMPVNGTNIQWKLNCYNYPTGCDATDWYGIRSIVTEISGGGVPGVANLTVNLDSPTNLSLSSYNSLNFSANYNYSYMNISNATYYIWHINSSLLNRTLVTVTPAANYSNLTIFNLTLGTYRWNVYACGNNSTDLICSWGVKGNYSFDIGGELLSENYSEITVETASERFLANFSLFPGSNIISAYLVYNGTQYVISDITNYGSVIELKRTININLNKNTFENETKQFYWSFIFSNGGLTQQNTTLRNQTVLPLNIVYCNDTFGMVGLNFTTHDETNPNPIINATFHTSWIFWAGDGSIKKNYSFEDTSLGNSSFKFCINQNYSTIHANLISEMTSPNYFPRTYYLTNATINNITKEIPLRLINNTLGVKFFHTVRQGVARISGATIIISKFDVGLGTWVVVGIRQSDDDGQFIEYLELDKDYTYSITKDGNFLGSIQKTSTCQATPCTTYLDINVGSIDLWKGYYDIYAPNVVYNISYDKTTHNVTYTFIDTSGLATYFRLQINQVSANSTGNILCDKTLYTTVGSIVCDLSGKTGNFIARGYVARSPEKIVATFYGILDAITEIIGKNEGLFFTLLLVLVVGLIGAFNPVVGVLLAGLAFIFAGIMGFVMISVTAMIMVVILIIILIIKMGRNGV